MKKLHIICGMCGCLEDLTYSIDPEGRDIDGELLPGVTITCENCSTVTGLDEHIKEADK